MDRNSIMNGGYYKFKDYLKSDEVKHYLENYCKIFIYNLITERKKEVNFNRIRVLTGIKDNSLSVVINDYSYNYLDFRLTTFESHCGNCLLTDLGGCIVRAWKEPKVITLIENIVTAYNYSVIYYITADFQEDIKIFLSLAKFDKIDFGLNYRSGFSYVLWKKDLKIADRVSNKEFDAFNKQCLGFFPTKDMEEIRESPLWNASKKN